MFGKRGVAVIMVMVVVWVPVAGTVGRMGELDGAEEVEGPGRCGGSDADGGDDHDIDRGRGQGRRKREARIGSK